MKARRKRRFHSATRQKSVEVIQPMPREKQPLSHCSLLACYAHPDDEQGISGTLAHYARLGVRTGLLCATRGELGEIADLALATPATLGQVREQELRHAAAILHIQHLWFLDYRDSGMRGDAGNRDPKAFLNANEQEALGNIVRVIRTLQPTVIITFDASGGYGHPDHVRIHDLTTKAVATAQDAAFFPEAGQAWKCSRLFYASLPRSSIRQLAQIASDAEVATNFAGMQLDQLGLPDEQITHQIDVRAYAERKRALLLQHRTQLKPGKTLLGAPAPAFRDWRGAEYHAMLAGFPLEHLAQPNGISPAASSGQHAGQAPDTFVAQTQASNKASWGAFEHFVLAAGVPAPHTGSEAGGDLFAGLHQQTREEATLGQTNQEVESTLNIGRKAVFRL